MTENIQFTNEAVAGLVMQSLLMMILPVVPVIVWKVKTHEKLLPVVVGAATWFLFAIVLKLAPAYLLLQADNPAAKTISGNIWYTMILAGVLAGVFEETGRFVAFRTVLKKYEHRRTSLTYGIGHGGFESIYIGFQMFSLAVLMTAINNGMGETLTGTLDEAGQALLASQLEPYGNLTFGECLLGVYERIPAIVAHIAFSVLVFTAARDRKRLYLYPLAVFLHALTDFSIVFYQAGLVPMWAMELIITLFAAGIAWFAAKVYAGGTN